MPVFFNTMSSRMPLHVNAIFVGYLVINNQIFGIYSCFHTNDVKAFFRGRPGNGMGRWYSSSIPQLGLVSIYFTTVGDQIYGGAFLKFFVSLLEILLVVVVYC